MSKVKIGVVENEMVIADTICLTLRKLGYEVLPPSPNYNTAIKMIDTGKPDLLLLDINLGGQKDGIDVAQYVRNKLSIPVIFLTANSDIATVERAKQVNPNAYLVKPFTKEDLYSAIEIAISNFNIVSVPKTQESILIKDGYDFIKIHFKEILYLGSDHNYVTFYLINGKKAMMRSTMQEMVDKLPKQLFIRLNRSFIVNIQHISKIETDKIYLHELEFTINKPIHDLIVQQVQEFL